jgi:hypothetical protein
MSEQKPRLGAGDPCPACGSRAGTVAGETGYACAICGCPRIVVDPPVPREGREGPLLVEAKKLAESRVGWGVAGAAGAVGTLVAAAGAGLLSMLGDFGVLGQSVLGLAVVAPFVVSVAGFLRVRRAGAAVERKLDEAAVIVTIELARAEGGNLEAGALARRLHVPEPRAEELVARAQVEGLLALEMPEPRVRVETGGEDASDEMAADGGVTRRRHDA